MLWCSYPNESIIPHTGQIHEAFTFKTFVREQIRAKLELEHFEGPVKSSKVRSHMKWWVKCISAVIAKTASRNVAFKARRLSESIMESQDSFSFIMQRYILETMVKRL